MTLSNNFFVCFIACILQCEDLMKNMIRERQDEIAAKDETIHKLQGEKQTLAQKVLNLEQEVRGLIILVTE